MIKTKKVLLFFVLALFLFSLSACEGAVGPEGPQGPAGPTGAQGPAGEDGEQGPTGPAGPVGPEGPTGPTGPAGPTGPVGPAGEDGLDGEQGPVGPEGPVGPAGEDGLDGEQGPVGPEGPVGPAGEDGLDGEQGPVGPVGPEGPVGEQGEQGLSAYDIYLLNYPGYEGTEAEWIQALATNELVVTLTVEYTNDVTDELEYLAGDVIGESPYAVNWYTDAAFTMPAKDEFIPADMTVYINLAGDDTPEQPALDAYVISAKNFTTDADNMKTYKFVSGTSTFVLAEDVYLYDATGTLLLFGDVNVYDETLGGLDVGDIVTEITVLDGKVIELRYASASTDVKDTSTTDGVTVDSLSPGALTIDFGTSVAGLLNGITSVDGRDQNYTVKDSDGDVVSSGTIGYGSTLTVLAENEDATAVYTIDIINDPNVVTLVDATTPTPVEEWLSMSGNIITVWTGTTFGDLDAALTNKATDSTATVTIVNSNSEFTPQTDPNHVVVTGDKITVDSDKNAANVYVIMVVDSANTNLVSTNASVVVAPSATDSVFDTESSISFVWNKTLQDVAGALAAQYATAPQTNTWTITAASVAYTYDGTNFVAEDDTVLEDADEVAYVITDKMSRLQAAGTLQLTVTAQDEETTKVFTFVELDSDSTNIEPVAGNKYVNDALEGTTNTMSVNASTTVAELSASVEALDGSTVSVMVKNSAGTVRNSSSMVYSNDTVIITSESGSETASYLLTVEAKASQVELPLVDEPQVITSSQYATTITVKPNIYSNNNLIPTTLANITNDLTAEGPDFQTYELLMEITKFDTDGTTVIYEFVAFRLGADTDYTTTGTQAATIEGDLKIRVYAQNHTATVNNFQDYTVLFNAESGVTQPILVTDYNTDLIYQFGSSVVSVYYETLQTNGLYTVNANMNAVLAQFDFASYNQKYVVGRYTTALDPSTWVQGPSSVFDDNVIRVYAEDYDATSNPNSYADVKVDYFKDTDNNPYLVSDPKVVNSSLTNVYPEYWNGFSYSTTTWFDIISDIDKALHFQDVSTQIFVYDNTATDYVVSTKSFTQLVADGDDMYVRITSQSDVAQYHLVSIQPESNINAIYPVSGQTVFTNSGSNIEVAYGTTVADLLGAINVVDYFQTAAVTLNDGTVKNSGILNVFDVLKITAQDGTVAYYTVTDTGTAPQSDDTSLNSALADAPTGMTDVIISINNSTMTITVSKYYEADADGKVDDLVTEAMLLAQLNQLALNPQTFAIESSSNPNSDASQLFSYDRVLVTAEDSVTTDYYTIIVE